MKNALGQAKERWRNKEMERGGITSHTFYHTLTDPVSPDLLTLNLPYRFLFSILLVMIDQPI